MPRVVHFELPADDPERATRFYGDVFGWKFQKWDGPMEYWLVTTGENGEAGIDGGLLRRPDPNMTAAINTIDVPSVDEYLEKVTAAGGTVTMPKSAIPGVGWFAYCRDTEGTLFGIMQADPTAA